MRSRCSLNVVNVLFDDKWGPVDGYKFVVERLFSCSMPPTNKPKRWALI